MRGEPEAIDASVYAHLKHDQHLVPDGASELDWPYRHVPMNLLIALNAFLGADPNYK